MRIEAALLVLLAACKGDEPSPDDCSATCEGGLCIDGDCVDVLEVTGAADAFEGRLALEDGTSVRFGATADGDGATGWLEASSGSRAEVVLTDPDTMTLTWEGVQLDGAGALTSEEQDALQALDARFGDALGLVPLWLGCDDAALDPASVAALLVPWQAVLKYLEPDRDAAIKAIADQTACAWFLDPVVGWEGTRTNDTVRLSHEVPVPDVFGFFPFDDVGQIESTARSAGDNFGPCDALCRGACGADCDEDDCTVSAGSVCETDVSSGGNTGRVLAAALEECGTAQGCREHDDCYDTCHLIRGCGSWGAAWCRRGCDIDACSTYGVSTCTDWARGFGPKDDTPLVFDYINGVMAPVEDLDTCPVGPEGPGSLDFAAGVDPGTRILRTPPYGFEGPTVYAATSTAGSVVGDGLFDVEAEVWTDIDLDVYAQSTDILTIHGSLAKEFITPDAYLWEAGDGSSIAVASWACNANLQVWNGTDQWVNLGALSGSADGSAEYLMTFDPLTDFPTDTAIVKSWYIGVSCLGDEVATDAQGNAETTPLELRPVGLSISVWMDF